MAKNSVRDYSATNSLNTDIQSIDISEGCSPAGINNAVREVMADLKDVSTGAVALETPSADQLNVDNLRLDGNTISSTDTNGNISLSPNGTGNTVASTGNVGIGTSNPAAKVDIKSTGATSTALRVLKSSAGQNLHALTEISGHGRLSVYDGSENEDIRLDSNGASYFNGGNVGIGTASPAQLMHVNNSGGDAAVQIQGNTRSFKIEQNNFGLRISDVSAGSAERLRVDAAGNVLVGTATQNPADANDASGAQISQAGTIQASASGSTPAIFNRGSDGAAVAFLRSGSLVGSISITTTSTAYNTSSDYRLKENVAYDWDATTRLKQLKPARFNFIADADTTVDGFLAHEAQTVVPEAVTGTKDAMRDEEYEVTPAVLDDDGNEVTPAEMGTRSVPVYQGIDQSKLVPLLVKTIQELEARITALETK